MKWHNALAATLLAAVAMLATNASSSEPKLEASDPIASVERRPVFLGELHLLLTDQLGVKRLEQVRPEVMRAAALMLVRRHLALKELREQGGEAIDAIIRRKTDEFARELQRRGSSLEEYAENRSADVESVKGDLAWRIAWDEYRRSRLTEDNLRRFFESRRLRYAGGRWEVSQIFAEVDPDQPDSESIAQFRLQRLAETLRGSDDVTTAFAAAARTESDSGSAADGGLVGWVQSDSDLPRPVMNAIRNGNPGEVIGPVESSFGLHLLLIHRFAENPTRFEELTDHARLRRDATDALFQALVAAQRDAEVAWLVPEFQPPADASLVPAP